MPYAIKQKEKVMNSRELTVFKMLTATIYIVLFVMIVISLIL